MSGFGETVDTIYRGGVIRPVEPRELDEGEMLRITIAQRDEGSRSRWARRLVVLGGLCAGKGEVAEEDVEEAKGMWERGVEKQLRIISEGD